MMNFRRARLVAFMGLAACGSDKSTDSNIDAPAAPQDAPADSPKVFMDAPPPSYDFSCMGNAAPTTATASITLSGKLQQLDLQGTTPSTTSIANATVAACNGTAICVGGGLRDTATSDANGDFLLPISNAVNNSPPLDVYLSGSNARPTFVFPPSPFVADQPGIPILVLSSGVMTALGIACGHSDTGNGLLLLALADCNNKPITDTQNVTITLKYDGNAVAGTTVFNIGQLASQLQGTFFVCNVPATTAAAPLPTIVSATYKGMPMLARPVRIQQGGTTETVLRPGY